MVEKMQIVTDGSKSYQNQCCAVGLDLSIVAAHIRHGYGLIDSSQATDPHPLGSEKSMVDQATLQVKETLSKTSTQA